MKQLDVFGGETLVKEAKRAKPATKMVATTPESDSSLIATIERKATLKNHQIVVTSHYIPERRVANENSLRNLTGSSGEFNGYMSPTTKRQVCKIIETWTTAVELNKDTTQDYRNQIYFTFVTLTLPSKQLHSDQTIKNQMLDPFVEWLKDSPEKTKRKGCNVEAYLWRAESQENGNLHFHLICDRWIDHQRVRQKWNDISERLGYVSRYKKIQEYFYRDGFKIREEQAAKQVEMLQYIVMRAIEDGKSIPDTRFQENPEVREVLNAIILEHKLLSAKELKLRQQRNAIGLDKLTAEVLVCQLQHQAYEKGVTTGWSNPNSTDIHRLGNINSVSAYVTKYATKLNMIMPLLEKNQKALKKDSDGKAKIYTLSEGGSWSNLFDYYQENAPEYIITYTTRMVRGKIWGHSRKLTVEKEDKVKIEPPNFVVEMKFLEDDEQFGRRIHGHSLNEDVTAYIDEVKKEIPAEEIERLDQLIANDYCQVIPLGKYVEQRNHKTRRKERKFKVVKQIDFLQKINTGLKIRYLDHYKAIFNQIYFPQPTIEYQTAA